MSFHAVRSGEVHVGEDIVPVRRLTRPSATVRLTIHRFCQFRVDAAGLITDSAPGGVCLVGGGCGERLAQQRRQARLLRLRDTGEQVSRRVNAAALPCRALQDLGGGRLQALMRIRDDQLHALEAALHEAAQELHPEHHRLAVADRQPDDFPSAIGVGGHCYCGRNADCSPALAYLEAGGAKPEIGPRGRSRNDVTRSSFVGKSIARIDF